MRRANAKTPEVGLLAGGFVDIYGRFPVIKTATIDGLVGVDVDGLLRAAVAPRGRAGGFFPCAFGVGIAAGVTAGWFGQGFRVVIGYVQRILRLLLLLLLLQWWVAAETGKKKKKK